MLEAALYGFHGAKLRFDHHEHDHGPADVIVPLAEALWWATTLDEALANGDPTYDSRRNRDHEGQHVRGARFARNRINHQLVLAIERTEGMRFPMSFPMRFHDFLWLPMDLLPEGRPDPVGQQRYEQHLAGRPARLTLHAAAGWFAMEQNHPGSALHVMQAPTA